MSLAIGKMTVPLTVVEDGAPLGTVMVPLHMDEQCMVESKLLFQCRESDGMGKKGGNLLPHDVGKRQTGKILAKLKAQRKQWLLLKAQASKKEPAVPNAKYPSFAVQDDTTAWLATMQDHRAVTTEIFSPSMRESTFVKERGACGDTKSNDISIQPLEKLQTEMCNHSCEKPELRQPEVRDLSPNQDGVPVPRRLLSTAQQTEVCQKKQGIQTLSLCDLLFGVADPPLDTSPPEPESSALSKRKDLSRPSLGPSIMRAAWTVSVIRL